MLEGEVVARRAQAVNFHRQRPGLRIRDAAGFRLEDLTCQAPRVVRVVSLDLLAQNVDQGGLCPAGNDSWQEGDFLLEFQRLSGSEG